MSAFTIKINDLPVEKVEFLKSVVDAAVNGRWNEFRMLADQGKSRFGMLSVNHLHHELAAPDRTDPRDEPINSQRSVWDEQMARYVGQDGWVGRALDDLTSAADREKLRRLAISRESPVLSLGSCFANNIAGVLATLGFSKVATLRVEEAVNSPGLIRRYLNPQLIPAEAREAWEERFEVRPDLLLRSLADARLLILTFGVGLELRSTASGDMDLDAHGAMERLRSGASAFVFPTVEEQAGHIVACLDAIARHAPALPVVVTLSPVPLGGYFGELNVATANALSKANLRQAIALARQARSFIYAPIYEMVSSIAPCVMNTSVWGDGKTSRHPSPALVKDICSAFVDMLGRTDATPT
jgi:hypothetical protein